MCTSLDPLGSFSLRTCLPEIAKFAPCFHIYERLQTSTRLITPAGSAHIVEHRDELGAHEVPST